MGAWGDFLFENDADLDVAIEMSEAAGIELYLYEVMEGEEYDMGGKGLKATRTHLDSGVLKRLFDHYNDDMGGVILAALAMHIGVKIPAAAMRTLHSFYQPGYVNPESGSHFYGGKRDQFKIALDHYKNDGTPYDFHSLRCKGPGCNKANSELPAGETLMTCAKCKEIRYCSLECQKAHWKKHKKVCKSPEDRTRADALLLNAQTGTPRGLIDTGTRSDGSQKVDLRQFCPVRGNCFSGDLQLDALVDLIVNGFAIYYLAFFLISLRCFPKILLLEG